jgi:hypothetical protein
MAVDGIDALQRVLDPSKIDRTVGITAQRLTRKLALRATPVEPAAARAIYRSVQLPLQIGQLGMHRRNGALQVAIDVAALLARALGTVADRFERIDALAHAFLVLRFHRRLRRSAFLVEFFDAAFQVLRHRLRALTTARRFTDRLLDVRKPLLNFATLQHGQLLHESVLDEP